MSDICPVCKTVLNEKKATQNLAFSEYAYDCPRCGKFMFTFRERDLERALNNSDDNDKRSVLSHNIRKMQKDDSEVILNGNLIKEILKKPLPSINEQANNLIMWFAENSSPGEKPFVQPSTHQSIIGAKNPDGFAFILKHLFDRGLLDGELAEAMGAPGRAFATLSFDGWEYYEELKRGDSDKQKPMAIESIPKQQTDEVHDSSNSGNTSMEWDVFICHASEDKEDFVEPLANALKEADIKVWYDRFELKLGDSLRDKIDEGLANSRYGIIILSHYFFEKKKKWTRTELDALVTLENQKGEKVILPIWHRISVEEVEKHSPILASKLAAQSSDSLESIVIQIENVLNESSAPQKPTKDKRETAETKKPTPVTSTEKLLTDPGDITNKLIWWLGQQCEFVLTQTRHNQPVVWHFSVIDERNKLSPGSAKKYLPEILNSNESPFPAIVENVSPGTIRLKYDFSPYLPTAGRFPQTSS